MNTFDGLLGNYRGSFGTARSRSREGELFVECVGKERFGFLGLPVRATTQPWGTEAAPEKKNREKSIRRTKRTAVSLILYGTRKFKAEIPDQN
jgi:hypothetical protein